MCYILMNLKTIFINTKFITLGAFLKFTGHINQGSEAANFLIKNKVIVNDEEEKRRGRKIYPNYLISINNNFFIVKFLKKEG